MENGDPTAISTAQPNELNVKISKYVIDRQQHAGPITVRLVLAPNSLQIIDATTQTVMSEAGYDQLTFLMRSLKSTALRISAPQDAHNKDAKTIGFFVFDFQSAGNKDARWAAVESLRRQLQVHGVRVSTATGIQQMLFYIPFYAFLISLFSFRSYSIAAGLFWGAVLTVIGYIVIAPVLIRNKRRQSSLQGTTNK